MSDSIQNISSQLTRIAELVMDIDPDRLPREELRLLKDRLPAWALTVSVIDSSLNGLEKTMEQEFH